ncbi:helical backbone metal receptor [Chitinispirillales bacterium ANBcel5]|uniref:ABC transporter substrate-binding protein n=1 Tax=Cellulosispirillum alkaliphilum TaxID=3039283 RepID=UPI002A4F9F5F|nr:helical backbone metal receptor [Chitinispirillales bacterium ANBcel5]
MRLLTILIVTTIVNCILFFGCGKPENMPSQNPQRIISLAPSITETLFALGLGDRVIGVTSYCKHPPQTEGIEKIGGYADANLERIISLKPDVVILTGEHEKQRIYLERFSITTLVVENYSISAICSSFAIIGRHCGVKSASDSLIGLFADKVPDDGNSVHSAPKVLICVGRDNPGAGRVGSVFAAGKSTFYNDLVEAAGGVNAFFSRSPNYPRLSPEGILSLEPDIIIDIASSMGEYSCDMLINDWSSFTRLPAVRNNNVFCLSNDYATIPGPRMLLLLEDIRKIIAQ